MKCVCDFKGGNVLTNDKLWYTNMINEIIQFKIQSEAFL